MDLGRNLGWRFAKGQDCTMREWLVGFIWWKELFAYSLRFLSFVDRRRISLLTNHWLSIRFACDVAILFFFFFFPVKSIGWFFCVVDCQTDSIFDVFDLNHDGRVEAMEVLWCFNQWSSQTHHSHLFFCSAAKSLTTISSYFELKIAQNGIFSILFRPSWNSVKICL